jgi:Zn finger protein HypA/HybF involved in hydrogenase expression
MDKKEKFINKAIIKFGDKFNYDEIDYIDSTTKIKIKCNKHNLFFYQAPSEHLRNKNGCNVCTRNPKVNTDYFVQKSKEIHGDKYDYSLTEYVDSSKKVDVICKEHGVFSVLPNNHYKQNCPKCKEKDRYLTTKDFIDKACILHNKYDYSETEYINSKTKVIIKCKEHGVFEQIPNDHLNGKGCPKCGLAYNKMEDEIKEFIKSLNINIIENSKQIILPLELDIFIPSHNLAIEFDGLYWHSEVYKDKNYHLNKTELCQSKNIRLIHIFEDEWLFKKEIVKSRLKNILGLTPNKVYGRKCVIKEVIPKEAKIFLENNHIQGNVNSKVRLGLYYNNVLIGLMTFGGLRKNLGNKSNENIYELFRFCNLSNYIIIGGADKLLKYFIKHYKPKEIISYADRRWSQGDLYNKLNFIFSHNTKPNYFYLVNDKRENRFNYRKDILVKEGFDKNKTEHDIMLERKLYRIYDCGSICFKIKMTD